MKNKTKYLLTSLLLLGFITYTSSIVMADDNTNYPPFVQTLAEKLGVDESKVEDAFDEIRADRFAENQQNYEDSLSEAVAAGVLTEEQKQALLAKHEEMQFEHQQEREQHHTEMQTWFAENGIDEGALYEYVGGPRGPHHMGMMH